jgi:hypothetical protein
VKDAGETVATAVLLEATANVTARQLVGIAAVVAIAVKRMHVIVARPLSAS